MNRNPPPQGGDVDRSAAVLGTSWALAALAMTFVAARVYCRTCITRKIWWDDWVIVITMVWSLTFTILWVVIAKVGGNRHIYYLSSRSIESALKYYWISQCFCMLGLIFGKLSVGFLIMRIGVPNRRMRLLLYFFMASQFIVGSIGIILVWAQCTPFVKLWKVETPGRCLNPRILTVWTFIGGCYFAFIDIALAAIPVSVIWRLQMPRGKKISLSLIMSGGVFAAICAAIKTSKIPLQSDKSDFTWTALPFLVWESVEINFVVIAACIPAMRPLYLIMFRRPGADHYRRWPRQRKTYQRHPSPHDRSRKKRGQDTELMSLDSEWNAGKLKGSDSSGEGSANQECPTTRQKVGDMMSGCERHSADVRMEGEEVVD